MATRKTLATRAVAVGCALGIIYAVFAGTQIVVALLTGRLMTEVVYPPSLPNILTVLLLLSVLTVTLGVAAWQTLRSTSTQSAMASGWPPGFVLLWMMGWGWVLLVYQPIPYRAHHIEKLLLASTSLVLVSLLYILTPGRLAAFLKARIARWLSLGLINVVVFIVTGEVVLRLADPWLAQRGPFGGHQTPSFLTPHARVEGSIDFSNSLGFKDRERTVVRTTSAPRMVAIGDSFTYGAVSYDDGFVTLLEQGLQERAAGAEVLNMGVPGWGPHEELALLRSTVFHFRPDLVLLNFYVGNDIIPDAHFEPAMVVGGNRYRIHATGNWAHDHLAPERWYLYHQMKYLMTMGPIRMREALGLEAGKPKKWRRPFHEFCGLYWREHINYFEYYWGQARDALDAIIRLLRSRGLDVLLVLHPDAEQLYEWTVRPPCGPGSRADRYDFERPQRFVREWSAMNEVPVIDLLPVFQKIPERPTLYLGDGDTHYSIEGNRLAAETILPILRDRVAHLNSHSVPGQAMTHDVKE